MSLIHARSTDKLKQDGAAYAVDEIKSTGGAAHVITIPGGATYTQTSIALGAARVRLTFDPPIKSAIMSVRPGAATTDPDEALLYCFNAPTIGVADAWLTETNIAPRHTMRPGDGPQGHYWLGDTVSFIDIIAVGTTPDLDVSAEGRVF